MLKHCSYFLRAKSWSLSSTSLLLEGRIVLSFIKEFWTHGNPGIVLEPREQKGERQFGLAENPNGLQVNSTGFQLKQKEKMQTENNFFFSLQVRHASKTQYVTSDFLLQIPGGEERSVFSNLKFQQTS